MITQSLEDISPSVAERYYATSPGNRKIRNGEVEKIARDMRNGVFQTTHQGIAFDEDGRLADGHHRLLAVISSGVTVRMWVARGVKRGDVTAIDTGTPRNFRDTLVFCKYYQEDDPLSRKKTAEAARGIVICEYGGSIRLSNDDMFRVMDALAPELRAIYRATLTRGYAMNASVNAAGLAALINGENESDVRLFYDAFVTGDVSGCGERNVSAAFNWRRQIESAKSKHVSMAKLKLYNGTQNAIWNFINCTDVRTIKLTKDLRYPSRWKLDPLLQKE